MKPKAIPTDLEALFAAAIACRDNGDFHMAMLLLKSFIKRDSSYVNVHLVLGDMLERLGKRNEAVTAFANAVKLRPTSETVSRGLFGALFDTGQMRAAVAEGKRYLKHKNSVSYRSLINDLEKELDRLKIGPVPR